MSSAFDEFYKLGSSNNKTTKTKGKQRNRKDNGTEESKVSTTHKKKVHTPGNSETITIDNVRIDFPLKPCM